MKIWTCMIVVAMVATMGYGFVIPDNVECQDLIGDEKLPDYCIPYLGDGRYLPYEDSVIGMTMYDYQANANCGQRLKVDDLDQAHINWMWQQYPTPTSRYIAWNARYVDGSFYGETQASATWSGYPYLDVTADANPEDQRTVIAYHWNEGAGYYSWIDIDGGNLWGAFGPPTSPEVVTHIWPKMCVASNNNIIIVSGNQNYDTHHMYLTTDMGDTWTWLADYDSCTQMSQFPRRSQNSNKVVHAWTRSGDLANVKQWSLDVVYHISTDNGATWGTPVNITNYTMPYQMVNGDSAIWAFGSSCPVFDSNDNLHIVWSVSLGWVEANTPYGGDRAKIFHWSEATGNTNLVSSPSTFYNDPDGWWLEGSVGGDPYYHGGCAGSWQMVADRPQLVIDLSNNDLYCLWQGNADSTDCSAGGFLNGELYASYSSDGGATWSDYTNLTNTPSHGAAPGACFDEDYFTANPFVVNDSIWVTFIEDKDAGGGVLDPAQGALTDNPVHCWVFPKEYAQPGIEEHNNSVPVTTALNLYPNPAANGSAVSYTMIRSGNVSLNLFDATGRLISNLDTGNKVAGTYNVDIDTRELANGTYFVILDTEVKNVTRSLVIIH